jgi:hypothetical protein
MMNILIRGNLDQCIQGKDSIMAQGEDSHLQVKDIGLEQIFPSRLLEAINTADILISDF